MSGEYFGSYFHGARREESYKEFSGCSFQWTFYEVDELWSSPSPLLFLHLADADDDTS